MRKFSSYGPIDTESQYYAKRGELSERIYRELLGDRPEKGGHYLTVWGPRQSGKSSVMLDVLKRFRQEDTFDAAIITMQSGRDVSSAEDVLELFVENLRAHFNKDFPPLSAWKDLGKIFSAKFFTKPVVLMIDEFDALGDEFIRHFANEFRNMYIDRASQSERKSGEKQFLLHGLALIGVRSVLGIENVSGSPFNVQRSLQIPNLNLEEVRGMFEWYERESGQRFDTEVVERLYAETGGQPGFVSWFGELLTETYNRDTSSSIGNDLFEEVYAEALDVLPNNTILNILSKAKLQPYRELVLDLFKTDSKIPFKYDNPRVNYLYLNGVIDREKVGKTENYVKFSSPYVQKRLFHYFSDELFSYLGKLTEPFDSLNDVVTEEGISVEHVIIRYQQYLRDNHEWLFKNAPRRADLRIVEAVYHFNFYMYLHELLHRRGARVWPEFPTGNGKLDIFISYQEQVYGIELKSFSDVYEYKKALGQAARYGEELGQREMFLLFFIESIDAEHRQQYEITYLDGETGVRVRSLFVETGM